MCVPRIFQWPTPWLWCAIGVLIAISRPFGGFVFAVCTVVIAASLIYYLREGRGAAGPTALDPAADQGLDQRLAEIERRLTDTQDVMIALSEKMDYWEEEKAVRTSTS